MVSASETILGAIKGNENIPWSVVCTLSKSEFNQEYMNVCKVLLSSLHPTMMKDGSDGREVDANRALEDLMLKPVPEIVIFLLSSMQMEKEESWKRDKLLSLLKSFVYERQILKEILLNQCKIMDKDLSSISDTLIRTLATIPDVVANVHKLKTPSEFSLEKYFTRLISVIHDCLRSCHLRILDGRDTSLEFVTRLLGKIVITGHSGMLEGFIHQLASNCSQDFIWRRISERLITRQSDSSIEPILKTVFCYCSSVEGIFSLMNQNKVVSRQLNTVSTQSEVVMEDKNRSELWWAKDRIKFLLTNKFIVITTLSEERAPVNLIDYSFQTDCNLLFIPTVKTALSAWTSSNSLRYRSHDQNMYIYSLLMVICRLLSKKQAIKGGVINKEILNLELINEQTRKEWKGLVTAGINDRISCPRQEDRDTGLFIGQTLMKTIDPKGPRMEFELDEDGNEDIVFLKKYLTGEFEGSEIVGTKLTERKDTKLPTKGKDTKLPTEGKDTKLPTKGELTKEISMEAKDEKPLEKKARKKRLIEQLSSDEEEREDEEMEGSFGDSEDIPQVGIKKPHYLADCIEGLGDQDNIEWAQVCLESLESLTRSNPLAARESAVEITRILLSLRNDSDTPSFQGFKIRSLLAACVSNPVPVAKFLTASFFDTNNCMSHRLDILQVLVLASHELSDSNMVKQLFGQTPVGSHELSDSNMVKQRFGQMLIGSETRSNCGVIQQQMNQLDLTREMSKGQLTGLDFSLESEVSDILVPTQVAAVERSWRQVVDERIQRNTRRITTVTGAKEGRENKFAKISGHFFFPLMDKYTGSEVTFYFDSFDSLILSRLIYSLSLILFSVSQSFESRRMAKCLLSFISEFTHHQEPLVKKSIVFALSTIITCCPRVYLFQELGSDLSQFKSWLLTLSENEPEDSLRNSSIESLRLLNCVIQSTENLQINN